MSEKVYPVTPEWSKRAHIDNARYLEMYAASIKDPVKFWGEEGKRIRLQDLPNLTKQPGAGNGFGAWPAYRVSNGQLWGMQLRLNDCYRQQRMPFPIYGSDVTIALSVFMANTANGGTVQTPGLKR